MEEFDAFFIVCILIFILFIILLFKKNAIDEVLKLKSLLRVISWNVLLTAFGVFTLFMTGEVYFRFFEDTTDSFAINKVSQRWLKRHVTLNNYDIRDNIPYQLRVAKGKRRLTIIGDSFTSGHGIKNIENRFANILRKKYPDIEVHIMAYPGNNSYSQLENLNRIANVNYQFDIVLLAYCLNDIDFYVEETGGIYQRIHAFNNRLSYLEKSSYFINKLSFRLFASKDADFMNYSDFVLKGYSGDSWKKQKETLKKIKEHIQSNKGKLAILTFPFLQQTGKKYSFREVHNKLGQFWKEEGVTHIDLLKTYEPYFGSQLTVNKYDAHPNEFAHQLAANVIEKILQKKDQ